MAAFVKLDPLLHSELRLAVMSSLLTVEEADFTCLKEVTGATAGNLSVQLDKLSEAGYIEIKKTFAGKKPRTLCSMTPKGRQAFADYVEALKSYLSAIRPMAGSGQPFSAGLLTLPREGQKAEEAQQSVVDQKLETDAVAAQPLVAVGGEQEADQGRCHADKRRSLVEQASAREDAEGEKP